MTVDISKLLETGYVEGINRECYEAVKMKWDKVSKPLDSMGDFEKIICRIGGIQETDLPRVEKNLILVFCADNGVVEEGISQTDQSITALCTSDIADGKKSVNVMARINNIDVWAIDVGVSGYIKSDKAIGRKIRKGTRNFRIEPAMTIEETMSALQTGFDMVKNCKEQGYDVIGIGEMGIGNTTTCSAVTAALMKMEAWEVTGRGAGLSDEGLAKKVSVIQEAIDKYSLYGADTLKVLMTVGGLDIAAMAGCCIGAAYYKIPLVLDGVISNAAALIAQRLVRGVKDYLIASHKSREKACNEIFRELQIYPVIDAGMALGEGTGAVMMISLIKTSFEVFSKCSDFDEAGMDAYTHYGEE